MEKLKFIQTEKEGRKVTVWLNRPEVHNALNAPMISELTFTLNRLGNDDATDIIILRGKGESFSSGADLNYMRVQATLGEKENYEDALRLAEMFHSVYSCRKVVITVAHGHIAGGANGLVAAADYAIGSSSAIFRFSEVRLGLVPATVSPYVIERVGMARAREMLLCGKAYSAAAAEKYGLINESCRTEFMDEVLEMITGEILRGSPSALRDTKQMINRIRAVTSLEKISSYTSGILAAARASVEGREGINAFLEKRKPFWSKEKK